MGVRSDEGVLITGVYGAGKSTVAAEISYLLEQRRQPYALLDLDFLGWGVNSFDGHAAGSPFMLRNLAAVVSNYREGGISVFVLAYFVSGHEELRGIREAVGVPLRVVRLSVPRGYDVDATSTSLEQHERGIHAIRSGTRGALVTGGARVTEVRSLQAAPTHGSRPTLREPPLPQRGRP